jgi:cell division septum initiation protein DivIVA
MISLFNEFFGFSYLLVESMILYILRNITLGAMAFFGMALSEVIILQKEAAGKSKNDNTQKTVETSQREVQLIIDEAKLKAEKIVYEAQQRADDLIERKSQIERRLKEFIAVEREIIKNYESEEE